MKNTLILSFALVTGSSAFGQLYFGAGVAYFFPEADTSITQSLGGADLSPEDGIGGIANIGYKIPTNGWHFEFEFQYYQPDSQVTTQATGAQSTALTGTNLGTGTYNTKTSADNYTLMGNVYYDFLATMETNWGIYLGGGLGATNLNQDVKVTGPGGTVSDDNDKWLFTYQVLGGISYQPIENLRFDLAYRYTVPEDSNFTLFNQNVSVDSYDFESVELSASLSF
jgi:opacity protein-like surface antigen